MGVILMICRTISGMESIVLGPLWQRLYTCHRRHQSGSDRPCPGSLEAKCLSSKRRLFQGCRHILWVGLSKEAPRRIRLCLLLVSSAVWVSNTQYLPFHFLYKAFGTGRLHAERHPVERWEKPLCLLGCKLCPASCCIPLKLAEIYLTLWRVCLLLAAYMPASQKCSTLWLPAVTIRLPCLHVVLPPRLVHATWGKVNAIFRWFSNIYCF